jgi:hypothetical protein
MPVAKRCLDQGLADDLGGIAPAGQRCCRQQHVGGKTGDTPSSPRPEGMVFAIVMTDQSGTGVTPRAQLSSAVTRHTTGQQLGLDGLLEQHPDHA